MDEIQPPDRAVGRPASLVDSATGSHLFRCDSRGTHTRALRLPVQTVMGVERTRATFLSYSKQDQDDLTADLRALLQPSTYVDLVQQTFLAMAPAATAR
jgi:hypothetical protein